MKCCTLFFCCILLPAIYTAGNDVRENLEAWNAILPPAYSPKPTDSYNVPLQWPSPHGLRQPSREAAATIYSHNNVQPNPHLPPSSHHSMNNAAQYSYGTMPALGTFSAYGISLPPPRGSHMQQSNSGYAGTSPTHSSGLVATSHSSYGCSFVKDDDCFGRSRGCAIKHAMPFERRAMLTLERCKTCCLSYVTTYFSCESFVYNNQHHLCDMFAHRGDVTPAILVPTLHHDYYEVISDKCRKSNRLDIFSWTTSKPVANVSSSAYLDEVTRDFLRDVPLYKPLYKLDQCKSDETLMYYKIMGRQLTTNTDPLVATMSAEQCVESCTANQDSEGRPIACRSFDYFPSSSQCAFHVGDSTRGKLVENLSAQHFKKTCLPRNLVSRCSKIILREPNKILVGYARTVVEIKSSRECIEQCLRAPSLYGYTCSSGVFYNEENSVNCILNSETKEQHADLLVEDRRSDVEYFQLLCGDHSLNSYSVDHEMAKPESNGNVRVTEKPPQRISNAVIIAKEIANDWTIWSPCETGTNIRKRYQVCDQFDIRNCPQEIEYCKGDINSAQPLRAFHDHVLSTFIYLVMSLLTFLPVVLICAKSKNKKGKGHGWTGENESPDQMVHSTFQQQGTQRERKKNQGELIDAIKKGVLIDPRNPDYATVQIKSTVFEFEEGGEKKKIKRDQL
ncbi:hypothetical protein M514_09356, partial [Trichuris suis]